MDIVTGDTSPVVTDCPEIFETTQGCLQRKSPSRRLLNDDALGSRLETAYGRMTKVLALTIAERQMIIRALGDPPAGG
jgi:hypothetical protein